jgi:hypothetical protein
MTKVWLDKAKRLYYYKGGEYLREKLAEKPSDVQGYRVKEVKPGVKVLLAIRRRRGRRGGRTVAVAVLRHWRHVARKRSRRQNK